MTNDEIVRRFDSVNRWRSGDEHAVHKPLLALLALGRLQRGESQLVEFAAIETKLRDLLRSFGPSRKSYHPEYPFWRLQNDGVWNVTADGELEVRASNTDPKLSELRRLHARGGFVAEIDEALRKDKRLVARVAESLLEMTFPSSLHDDVLTAVGLDVRLVSVERDPEFRRLVLRAYEYRCAFCGYDGRLDDAPIGIEAAHVRWHCRNGPSTLDNGVALCSLHHKAFDMGALGLTEDLRIVVSIRVNGGERTSTALQALAGQPLRSPQPGLDVLHPAHRSWHFSNIFKAPARGMSEVPRR